MLGNSRRRAACPPLALLASSNSLVHNEAVKTALELINQMQAAGLITAYAIGGAVGATFYLEPAATIDLDIFVTLPVARGLVDLAPIYTYLKAQGGVEQDE